MKNPNHDEQVNHPSHYNQGGVEVIEMMLRIWGHDAVILFCQMNAFKYRMRMGHKGAETTHLQDLRKAKWYEEKAKEYQDEPRYGLKTYDWSERSHDAD